MYKSPITIIESTIDSFSKAIIKQKDDAIFAEIQSSFGVDVDRQELMRALHYDRNQYEKGYLDGKTDAMASIVRCKDCFWRNRNYCMHPTDGMNVTQDDDFCSYGERREGE